MKSFGYRSNRSGQYRAIQIELVHRMPQTGKLSGKNRHTLSRLFDLFTTHLLRAGLKVEQNNRMATWISHHMLVYEVNVAPDIRLQPEQMAMAKYAISYPGFPHPAAQDLPNEIYLKALAQNVSIVIDLLRCGGGELGYISQETKKDH